MRRPRFVGALAASGAVLAGVAGPAAAKTKREGS
jgi:hypothetical protein